MTYCINPRCRNPYNPDGRLFCCTCGSELLLEGRYRVVEVLEKRPYTAVYEVLEKGRIKILKVLEQPQNKLVELFEKEAKVLQSINYPGIPKGYSYFLFKGKDSSSLYPCFVMEKIEGLNLQDYLKQRESRPIQEELAVEWLFKLANIVDIVHEKRLFHRDIKPSNIMLRSDGELVLIDFGAVREMTDTYSEALAKEEVTTISSQGYTAPEQCQGQAVPQSDFFALGRTFVYLLTGKEPYELPPDPKDRERKIWRNEIQISENLGNFIDNLMDPLPKKRPQNTKILLHQLVELQKSYGLQLEERGEINIGYRTTENLKNILSEPTCVQSTYYDNNGHDTASAEKPEAYRSLDVNLIDTLVNSHLKENGHERAYKAQKRIPIKKLLAGAAVFATVLVGGLVLSFVHRVDGCSKSTFSKFATDDNISCGEQIIITQSINEEKEEGVKAFAAGRYETAIGLLEKSWKKNSDPETLIYLNNARIFQQVPKSYTFAVVVPMTNNNDSINVSKEMLRGVAQAQDEFNKNPKTNYKIKILIATDNNNSYQAKKIAEALVKKQDVLGVVGHFTSDTTISAVGIYQQHKLPLISSTATSKDLSTVCRQSYCYFRRIAYSDRDIAQNLASYMLTNAKKRKAAVFFNETSNYSFSMRDTLERSFTAGGGTVVKEFDLSAPNFNPSQAISEVRATNADVIVLLPNNDGLISETVFRLIRANRLRYPIVGGDSLFMPNILEGVGNNAEGMVVGIPWHHLSSPNRQYTQATIKLWGEPVNWRTALSYDATRVFVAATEKLSFVSRENLEQTMAEPNFTVKGATGDISFLYNGDRKQLNIQQLVTVKAHPSTGQLQFVPLK
ncbi:MULTISPECIES: bifunctional serine/threonine-protein kinase/ABC transporter substrate-binding protein [Nostocales]|uniref:ABC transporter substrate-binding protein n=3 Tax=Nostocales TaxID=1161 RepID=A0A8S9TEP9_9CYAN|nr:bifunctional serine/threonine-protein kinase/ABC transporter substrate-binding protein [Tolypothrix bouteillei]KAF3890696.1 ABC transporter substrate-binding protein [Tolypothrix bouteillei VB521301]